MKTDENLHENKIVHTFIRMYLDITDELSIILFI